MDKKIEENSLFKAFKGEGIEPELEYKMEQLFGASVAQGVLKVIPSMVSSQKAPLEMDSDYVPTPLNGSNFSYASYFFADEMNKNVDIPSNGSNSDWQEV